MTLSHGIAICGLYPKACPCPTRVSAQTVGRLSLEPAVTAARWTIPESGYT